MFTIAADAPRKLIRVRLGGSMTVAEVTEFARRFQDEVRHAGFEARGFDTIIETEGAVVQSQDTMAAFEQLMRDGAIKSRRLAVVRSSALGNIQSRRIGADRPNYGVFYDVADAEAWLSKQH